MTNLRLSITPSPIVRIYRSEIFRHIRHAFSIISSETRRFPMTLSYNKMWKLMIDRKMTCSELRQASKVAPNTMTRIRRDEEVSLSILYRICCVLQADIGDIMEFLPDSTDE
ncbi:helix-turn-helix transcriptional regulator [Pseudoflavonifractor phocaeensis]|uniref:helix-turn-helix domain-containing protein n=1 Tax=Pseudoflavonifractor phocaeensis TaxID=1870988 RepID=UPI002E1A1DD9